MGGFFGVVSKDDCANSIFFGTDYHYHLVTRRGVISDYEDQPLIIGSQPGVYALVTVSNVKNSQELAGQAFSARAKMKLIPIRELTQGARMLFCDDSIVRRTQLYGCRFLNFSRSRSEYDPAARQAVREIIGENDLDPGALEAYADGESDEYAEMVERIRRRLRITSLRYQLLDDMISAIELSRDSLCTYCWTGS